jgi:putative inorganic carbon (HCO3(-)) transporter
MFLVPASLISLQIIDLVKNKMPKIITGLSFILPILGVYFSGSRGGMVALAIGAALFLNYRFINKRWATKAFPFHWLMFALTWIGLNAVYLCYAIFWDKDETGGDAVRIQIYRYAMNMLGNVKSFVFGIGLDNFQNKLAGMPILQSFRETGLSYALHPHNLLLAFWLNLGIIGLLSFIFLVASFFKKAYGSKNYLRAAYIAAMFAILVHGFFDTTYFKNDLAALFWLLIGAGLILRRESEHERTLK